GLADEQVDIQGAGIHREVSGEHRNDAATKDHRDAEDPVPAIDPALDGELAAERLADVRFEEEAPEDRRPVDHRARREQQERARDDREDGRNAGRDRHQLQDDPDGPPTYLRRVIWPMSHSGRKMASMSTARSRR